MKRFIKGLTISAISAAVGFAAVFGGTAIAMKQQGSSLDQNNPQTEQAPLTPQKKLLNKVMSIQTFNIDGDISLETEEDFIVKIGLDVDGDLSDISKLRIKGDLELNLNGLPITSELAYIEDTMFFSFGNSNFSLKTDNLMDFIEFLPEMGVNLSLPDELSNLDLNTITSIIDGMEFVETPAGDYFFEADIMGLPLRILTDQEYSFKGIRMDKTDFDGTKVGLDFAVKELPVEECDLTSPVAEAPIGTFKPLEPAFNIFKSLYNAFTNKQNTIGLQVGVRKGEKDILSTDINFSYDIDEMLFGLSGNINENNRSHNFDAFFKENTIYFAYEDLKVSIQCETIFNTISYVLKRLGVDVTKELLNTVVELLNDEDFKTQLSGIKNLVQDFTLEDDLFEINLDTNAIGLGLGTITPRIEFEDGNLSTISIDGLEILGIGLDVKLIAKEYQGKELIVEDYQVVEPVFTLAEAIIPLLEETQFRVEFNAVIGDGDETTNDVTFDGGLQFDIENHFGYGDISITDKKLYKHTIKGDMENSDEFYFSYNDKTNGKFTSQTINDVLDLLLDVVLNPDEHFIELFGDIIEKILNMPIMKALNGDIGLLFDTNIINSLSIEDEKMTVNVDLAMVNIDASFDLIIKYHSNNEQAFIDGLTISNLNLGGTTVELNAYLRPFDSSKAKERLDVTDKTKFLDFSDIKVLLELGINTSKFNYFHFRAELKLHIIEDLDPIPVDIKIRNNKGHVQVAAEFEKIPVIDGVLGFLNLNGNPEYINTKGRKASFYYDDGTIYLKRVDEVDNKILFIGNSYTTTYSRKMDSDYFLDNIANVLLTDLLGVNADSFGDIMGDGSSTESTGTQIKYEEILAGFEYNDNYSSTQGRFKFSVNLNSLLNLSIFDTVDLFVLTNKESSELDSISASLVIHVLINIKVELKITTSEKEQLSDSNMLTTMNNWVASRAGDAMNAWVKNEVKK